jgi:predicted unusual protein kinase regulating ubiquinone biosynthesis (AarF/ABC1/UbiB family)
MQRVRRIGATVGSVYLGLKANQLLARRLRPSDMPHRWRRFHRRSARTVYETAVDLRGLILKGCQFLGTRADVLPREWVEVLSRLQDRVPPKSFPEIRHTVERELGRRLEVVFRDFASRPVASASLAQVHEAVLQDGRRVAVKVQYPEIESLVRGDLESLRTLFRAIGWLERDFDAMPLVDELREHVPRELDFLSEAHNAERIAQRLSHRCDVRIPYVIRNLSTRRVLVMEFLEGIKITDSQALAQAGVDSTRVATILLEVYGEQILGHGLFHADPHPGNLLVDPGGPRLVLLDFGLVKDLPPRFREDLVGTLAAIFRGDLAGLVESLLRLGFRTRDGSRESLLALAQLVLELLQRAIERRALDAHELVRIGDRIAQQLRATSVVCIPSHIVLLARTVSLLSGVSRSLGVRIDPLQVVRTYGAGGAGPPGPPAA